MFGIEGNIKHYKFLKKNGIDVFGFLEYLSIDSLKQMIDTSEVGSDIHTDVITALAQKNNGNWPYGVGIFGPANANYEAGE